VSRAASTNENITAFKVRVKPRQKLETLRWLLRNDLVETAIVFANRKSTVRELNKSLQRDGFASGEIHGDMDQASRLKELERFKNGEINILVASDVAARGLDIKGVSHVFNYDTPWHPDDYVHRIGRTGRAGAKGRAFTFVTAEDEEAIANVEKLIRSTIPVFGKKDVRIPLEPAQKDENARKRGKERGDERAGKAGDARSERERKPRREARTEPSQPARKARSKPREEEARRQDDGRSEGEGHASAPASREHESRARRAKPSRSGEARGEEASKPKRPARKRGQGAAQGDHDREPTAPGEWNGPKPSFLDFTAR